MIIKKLHIENFGKLSNFDMNFDRQINQICAENGWGKSTLAVFLKAMFYGMAPSRDNVKMERKKYMPWNGGNFGGRIDFACEEGEFSIIRTFARTPEGDVCQLIDSRSNKEIEMPKEGLGEWLFGVGKDTFEMTAFFPQLKINSGANEQISAGVLGLEKFKFDLASVGDALAKIKKEVSLQKKNIVKESELERLKKQAGQIKIEIASIEKESKLIFDELTGKTNVLETLEKEVEVEKTSNKAHEDLFKAKLKIEEEISKQNQKLSSLLLKINSLSQEEGKEKTSTRKSSYFWVLGVVVAVAGVVLGAVNILPWIAVGIICGVGLLITALLYFTHNKDKKQMSTENSQGVEIQKLQAEIDQTRKQLEMLSENAKSFVSVSGPNNEKIELLKEKLFSQKLETDRLKNKYASLAKDKENLLIELDEIEENVQSFAEGQEKTKEKLFLLEQTSAFLSLAKENVSTRFVGPINAEFSNLLNQFEVRGREFVVDANFEIKENAQSGVKAFEHSSQGYQDILSFCMRFLLLKQVFKHEMPFVVLDDSFVNLDDKNFEKAKEIINEFSKEMQIVYICCKEKSKIK